MDRESFSSGSTILAERQTTYRRVRLPVVHADGGSHAAIYDFLHSIFQGLSPAEYAASLDDPFHEPSDRLLLLRRRRLAAHALVSHRTMYLDALPIPAARLDWLGVAPERRGQGLGAHLLAAVESQMAADGAMIGLMRTTVPRFFRRSGWALCGQASYRCANARSVLARLLDRGLAARPRRRWHIRPWLQWEQPALARIYAQNVLRPATEDADPGRINSGPLERTDAYWRWLLSRHGHDQVYVALEGSDQLELGEAKTRIVGYAATRGEQILELMTLPGHPHVAAGLLVRCCDEAIEHDRQCIVLHAPQEEPLFRFFDEAGGWGPPTISARSEVSMMRLLQPLELLQRMSGRFEHRADLANLSRPAELGLLVDGQRYQLELGREGCRVTSQRIGRSYLRLNIADFTRLVLGQLDWDSAVGDGRLWPSTALASIAGRALFPAISLWRPPWDEMLAIG